MVCRMAQAVPNRRCSNESFASATIRRVGRSDKDQHRFDVKPCRLRAFPLNHKDLPTWARLARRSITTGAALISEAWTESARSRKLHTHASAATAPDGRCDAESRPRDAWTNFCGKLRRAHHRDPGEAMAASGRAAEAEAIREEKCGWGTRTRT